MKLLLLVQSEADVSHLDAAARAILNSAITGVWVVFSPAITVKADEAAAKLDAEIAGLKKAEQDAAGRGDYTAAAGYKTQREGRELDRMKEISDAHKKLSAEDRAARTKVIFAPFIERLKPAGLNVKITGHSDHHDKAQWVQMLNSLSGVWFKEFTPGSFLVGWPESVETSLKLQQATPEPPAPEALPAARLPKAAPQTRHDSLQGMRTFALMAEAKKVGVDPKGKAKPALIAEILAAESAPAADLATY